MSDQIFCDGLQNASFVDGTMRLDFFVLSPTDRDKDGRPKRTQRLQIVMPPGGFMGAANAMQDLVKQMADKGVLQRRQAVTAVAKPPSPLDGTGKKSPLV